MYNPVNVLPYSPEKKKSFMFVYAYVDQTCSFLCTLHMPETLGVDGLIQ